MKDGLALTGIGIVLAAMLATAGCSETVVVTATPTATPTPTAIPTPTPVPTATAVPIRAACNKKIANVMRLFQTAMGGVEFFDSGSQISATADYTDYDEWATQIIPHLTDEESGYIIRWGQSVDDEDVPGTIFNMLIRDLEDGEC